MLTSEVEELSWDEVKVKSQAILVHTSKPSLVKANNQANKDQIRTEGEEAE